ncbi:MAG: VOC family protein [Dermatophilaceae bacterium]
MHLDETDRTHLDLWVDDETEQRAEVARLESLGATRIPWDYPDDADFVVLADPVGTRVLHRRHQPLSQLPGDVAGAVGAQPRRGW